MSAEVIYRGIQAFNKDVSAWAYQLRQKLKTSASSMAGSGKGDLAKLLKTNIRKTDGEIESISYGFPRHGVFFQKGVGRGHVMQGGKVIRGMYSKKVIKLLPGTVNRQPKDWFNQHFDDGVPKLADIVANHKADEAIVKASYQIK